MVKVPQKLVMVEMTHIQLKLCVIALDALDNLLKDVSLQPEFAKYIKRVEDSYELYHDLIPEVNVESWFSDNLIVQTNAELLEKYRDLPQITCLH